VETNVARIAGVHRYRAPHPGEAIARSLSVPLGRAHLARFSDGEVWFQIQDNVRGADVFVVQPTGPPVNENLMELLVMLDAFKRSSASRVTAVIPYYGYARQDRKDKPRVPISAKLVADLLSSAGTDRVLTMDLHSAQIQGFFNTPVDHLFAAPVIIDYISASSCRVSPWSLPTPGAWSARVPTPSGWMRRWPSSTSAARAPTWPKCITWSARWTDAQPWSSTTWWTRGERWPRSHTP
jgi:hypothetical protein